MQMCVELQSGPRVAMAGDWSKVKLYRSLHSLGFLYWSIDLLAEGWGNTLGWIFLSLVFCYSYENRNALMALLKWFCKWMCTPESFPVHHQCLWFPQNIGILCSFFIVLPFFSSVLIKVFYSRKILWWKEKQYWLPCFFLHVIPPHCSPWRSCHSLCPQQSYEGLNQGGCSWKCCVQRWLWVLRCSILGPVLVQVLGNMHHYQLCELQQRCSSCCLGSFASMGRRVIFVCCWKVLHSQFICSWQPLLYSHPDAVIRIPCWSYGVAKYPSPCRSPVWQGQ